MGTLSFDMKLPNMRKAQDFIVYPASEKTDFIMIQSSTRFGKINMTTGMGLMSQSHANGAYAVHMHIDKLVKFQLTDSQLEKLKEELAKTAGSSVGRSVVISDNSYADKFAMGGMMAKGGKTEKKKFTSYTILDADEYGNRDSSSKKKPTKFYLVWYGNEYQLFMDKPSTINNRAIFDNDDELKKAIDKVRYSSPTYVNYGLPQDQKFYKEFIVSEKFDYAKGGYVEEGEDYEYVNTFGIDQDDFEKLVDAYHKSPSYDQAERVESRLIFRKMREKYGERKIDEIGNYIHETHESHEHYAKGGETKFYGLGGDITKYKKTLISKAQKNGIYENFGEIEVNKLKDKYNYNQLVYGTPEQRQMARQIDMFDEWAMSYDGSNTFAKGGVFEVGDLVMVDDSGYAKAFSGFDTTKPAKIISKDKKKVFGKVKYFYGLEMADGRKPFNDAQESMLTKIAEKGAMFGAGHFAEGGAMAKRSAIVGANIDESDLGDLQKRGITIKKLNEMLTSKFPYSFGFKLYPVKDQRAIIPNTDDYYGVQDKELLLTFDRHHGLNYRVMQGSENTYFYFLLDGSDGKNYIGNFGFKDEGDVGNDYVTSFVAFLHKAYNQPFNVAHEVYARGGMFGAGRFASGGEMSDDLDKVNSVRWVTIPDDFRDISALVIKFENYATLTLLIVEKNILFSNWIDVKYFSKAPYYITDKYANGKYSKTEIRNEVVRLLKENRLDEIRKEGLDTNTLKYLKKYASGGELVDKTIDHDGRYLHLVGNHRMLHIHLNNEGREMIMDERESGRGDEEIMYDLFEDIVGNSTLMYHTDLGESGFGMTSSSGVTYDYGYDDNGDLVPLDDNAVVYVDNDSYRRSPVEELLEGRLIMRNSDFMARGGKLAGAGQFAKGGRSGKKHTMNGIVGTMENDDYSESVTIYGYDSHWDGHKPTAQEMKKTKQLLNEDTKILDDLGVKYKVDYEEGTNLPTITIKSISGKPATIESLQKVVSIKEEYAKGGVLKIGKDDFSFLLELSDKELSKRLDLIRKQQGINGEQYLKAREKGESTKAIEEAGERLAKQERAIIEARMRK
jgi:hypothetical protein